MNTIPNVLLIDDDESTNFIHQIVIEDSGCVENVVVYDSAKEALSYLNSASVIPDVIFLDINMPGMNGWEFLEQYSLLNEHLTNNIMLFVLSTSMNPSDEQKANENKFVTGFLSKSLTEEVMLEITDKYFSK